MPKPQSNMYADSVKQWNVVVGCRFDCVYCRKSFQAQMKRQRQNCEDCYSYVPHFHKERLTDRLPKTQGDEFVWIGSSSDVAFWNPKWIEPIFDRIFQEFSIQFFIQSKNSDCLYDLHLRDDFPPNLWLGITLETNRNTGYDKISKAPVPSVRFEQARLLRPDIVTIEPILDFDMEVFVWMIRLLAPRVVYIGYDTKKCGLPEPPLAKAIQLVAKLHQFTTVKWKLMREAWDSETRSNRRLEDYFNGKAMETGPNPR